MQVSISLITGWVSGQLFVPPAFSGRDLLTDPLVIRWELALIQAIVGRFKQHPAVVSWGPGNEIDCMQKVSDRHSAVLWLKIIANAIRLADENRHPIVSGMHSLLPGPIDLLESKIPVWTIQDNGEVFDQLTVHPYPLFTPLCDLSRPDEFRNCFHAAAESTFYATIGNRPCLVEEFGTFSRMFLGGESKVGYIRAALWNCWTHQCAGFFWWCANSHTNVHKSPYTWSSCERELGLVDEAGEIQEFAQVFGEFNRLTAQLPFALPEIHPDAVCLLTGDQDCWANAFGAFLLAEQAGLRLSFVCAGDPLPEASLYLVPGVSGAIGLEQELYEELLRRAEQGARVVFSCKDGFLSPADRFWGFSPDFIEHAAGPVTVTGDGFSFVMTPSRHYRIHPSSSQVWATADGEPVLFEQKYGAGSLLLLTLPVEEYAAKSHSDINHPEKFQAYRLYEKYAVAILAERPARSTSPKCSVSCHRLEERSAIVVAVNNDPDSCVRPLRLHSAWRMAELYHGSLDGLPHHGVLICRLEKQEG